MAWRSGESYAARRERRKAGVGVGGKLGSGERFGAQRRGVWVWAWLTGGGAGTGYIREVVLPKNRTFSGVDSGSGVPFHLGERLCSDGPCRRRAAASGGSGAATAIRAR